MDELLKAAIDIIEEIQWCDRDESYGEELFGVCPMCGGLNDSEKNRRIAGKNDRLVIGHEAECEIGRLFSRLKQTV